MTDKEAQLKAKLLKMKLAGKLTDYQKRDFADKLKDPLAKKVPFGKDDRDPGKIRDDALDKSEASTSGKKVRPKTPTDADRARIITAKAKVNKLKKKSSIPDEIMQEAADAAGQNKNLAPSYIAQDHKHSIIFKGHRLGGFKGASLNSQSGKFAKYWLLNAKETNGNGWGIAAHTAKENMKKFIGRPLVVTAKSWHGASEYGEEYEHPYLPTNDISAILNHQDKFRVGSIVDVFEDNNGDWFANIEMLPKFASRTLPPFCSPAIYQLDAKENEGQISKWEALHLAALNENPAYGARIALLKGTCIGTGNECKVQFKAAKLEGKVVCTKKLKGRVASLKKKQKIASPIDQATGEGINFKIVKPKQPLENRTYGFHKVPIHPSNTILIRPHKIENQMPLIKHFRNIQHKELPRLVKGTVQQFISNKDVGGLTSPFGGKLSDHAAVSRGINQELKKGDILMRRVGGKPGSEGYGQVGDTFYIENDSPKGELFKYESKYKRNNASPVHKTSKLKTRLAEIDDDITRDLSNIVKKHEKINSRKKKIIDTAGTHLKHVDYKRTPQERDDEMKSQEQYISDGTKIYPTPPNKPKDRRRALGISAKLLKARLASLGEQNMTYQDSKKVKIIKKKHPEVRKAKAPNDLKKRISKNRYSENIIPNTQGHSEMSTKTRGKGYENNFSYYEGTKGTGRQLIRDPLGDPRDVAETVEHSKMTPDGKHTSNINTMKNKLKRKLAKVRKASLASEFEHNDIEGVLRKIHSSPLPPDKREHQSSFLSSTGDYIGGGEDHTDTIKSIFKDKEFTPEDKANDGPVTRFSTEHGLPRVQRRMTQRGGRVSFGIHSKVNRTQLRTMQDVEKGGEELAFVVGKDTNGTVGEGYRDLTKALRENKFL